MGNSPIQTMLSTAAHPLRQTGRLQSSRPCYTVLHKGLSVVFVHRAATPNAHG